MLKHKKRKIENLRKTAIHLNKKTKKSVAETRHDTQSECETVQRHRCDARSCTLAVIHDDYRAVAAEVPARRIVEARLETKVHQRDSHINVLSSQKIGGVVVSSDPNAEFVLCTQRDACRVENRKCEKLNHVRNRYH